MEAAEQLQREDANRRIAVPAAVLGAVLPLGGAVLSAVRLGDAPANSPGRLLYIDDHASELVLTAVILGLGAIAIGVALRHLFAATRFRRPEVPRVALVCLLIGPLLYLVGQVASQVILSAQAADFAATGSQTYEEARSVLEDGVLTGVATAVVAGQLALGFAFVMISLNAMRVGLLTRFMGVLGVIVGLLTVIPIGGPLPVVQTFWLLAMAVLFAGRWPQGTPPAWSTGRAEPWPSQQELREERERGGAGRERGGLPASEPAAEVAAPGPEARIAHPASKKRKRKKRR